MVFQITIRRPSRHSTEIAVFPLPGFELDRGCACHGFLIANSQRWSKLTGASTLVNKRPRCNNCTASAPIAQYSVLDSSTVFASSCSISEESRTTQSSFVTKRDGTTQPTSTQSKFCEPRCAFFYARAPQKSLDEFSSRRWRRHSASTITIS